jgi:YYY domain-containing protein
MFATKAAAGLLDRDTYDQLHLVGRFITAALDVFTILLVFLIARRLGGLWAGASAATLYACAVQAIQQAHFFTTDTWVTFFATLALWWALRWQEEGRWYDLVGVSVIAGLALASKLGVATLAIPIGLAFALRAWRGSRLPDFAISWALLARLARSLLVGAALVYATLRLFLPYVFASASPWDPRLNPRYTQDIETLRYLAGGDADFPPSYSWATTDYALFPIEQMFRWEMGWALAVVAWLGLLWGIWRVVRHRNIVFAPVVVWVLAHYGYQAMQFAKPGRYFLPIFPAFAVLGGAFLCWIAFRLWQGGGLAWLQRTTPRESERCDSDTPRRNRLLTLAGPAIAALVLSGAFAWAFAYTRIYTEPVARVRATTWIYQNIPAGTVLAAELWDDSLPLRLSGHDQSPADYQYVQLPVFNADTPEKLGQMVQALTQTDYIVISSKRTHGVIRQLPARYPMTAQYYRYLFAGSLGFSPVHTFTHFPSLLGWEIDDSAAEEQFIVFDHPTVHLFVKTESFDPERVRDLLAPHLTTLPQTLTPYQLTYNGLLLADTQRQNLKGQGTWSSYFDRNSFVNAVPWLVWWLAMLFLGWITWPLLWRVFAPIPDRGYLLAKSFGLLFVAFIPWWLANLGVLAASRASTWLAVLIIGTASAWVLSRTWQQFALYLKDHRKEIAISEAVFTATFAFFLWVRLTNPDLWHPYFGGEKPMDFAHMNALVKAGQFPSYDPWFAGGYINYYYMGHQVFSTFIRWLGIVPSVAYNLTVPLVAALFAANVYTFASTVWREASRGMRLLAGVGGIVFVAVLGNLDGAVQWFFRLTGSGDLDYLPAGREWLGQTLVNLLRGEPPPGFDYWRSTRLIERVIHEFPFFSFLYGDLHPHVLALPFTMVIPVLALALVLSYRPNRIEQVQGAMPALLSGFSPLLRFPVLPLLLLGGFVLGFLRTANTWDYPTYALLLGGAIVLVEHRGLFRAELSSWLRVSLAAIGLYLVGSLAFAPYLDHYQTFFLGVRGSEDRTPLWQYLVIHGVPLFFVAIFLARDLLRWRAALDVRLAGVLIVLQIVLASVLWRQPLLLLLQIIALLAVVVALRPGAALPVRLLAGMVALAALLGVFPEFFAIDGDVGRMNTVFKFYLQAWNLLALVAAAMLPYLWQNVRLRLIILPAGTLLVLLALIYPLSAIPDRAEQRLVPGIVTLDGTAFMQEGVIVDQNREIPLRWDLEAIHWLQDNVDGTPTVLEATIPYFRWGGRVAIHTGLPTVLGWDSHQWLQRWEYRPMIEQRKVDVQTIYETADLDLTLALLRQYDVDYIYLGDLERAYYTGLGLAKFDLMSDLGIVPVYRNERVRIYRVSRDREGG